MTESVLRGLTLPDGGCRDINLFGVLPDGAHRLVTWLHAQFESRVCKAYRGNSEVDPFDAAAFRRPLDAGDSIWGLLNGGQRCLITSSTSSLPRSTANGLSS